MSNLRSDSGDRAYAPAAPAAAAPVASTLLQLWQDGRRLDALSADLRPRTLSEGYDIQDAFVAMTGDAVAGWKLGVGSPAAMRKAATERALIGRLLCSRCTVVDSCAPPPIVEIVTIAAPRPVTVEFEIAFVLGRDVKPGDAPRDLMDTVAAVHVGIELVLSRFVDRRTVGQPSFAADNVGFEAYLCGAQIDRHRIAEVVASVEVQLDGVCAARGLYGDEAVDPLTALGHLFDHASERGITLHRGDIVTTGAAASPFDVFSDEFEISVHYLDTGFSARVKSI
jgi:2-keto-4-pentenoate hydratase